jgi:hypothetical protein
VSAPGETWIDKVRRSIQTGPDGRCSVAGLSTVEAEMLLDWLELHGREKNELVFDPDHGFTVRWCGGADGKANPAAPD